jgi:hypothetical protein
MTNTKMKGPDAELEKLQAKVVEASKFMEPHYYKWILDAARDYFMKQIEKSEMLIVRHAHHIEEPYVHYLKEGSTRQEEIASAESALVKYRAVLRFTLALHELHSHMYVQDFAAGIAAWWRAQKEKGRAT